jgi:CRP/FNR family cyclic AMP-dependent transcriptional regulator
MTVTNPCGDPNMTAAHTVELFSKVPEALRFDPGAVIFSQGEAGTVMYGILEGQINLVVQGQVVETIAAGDVFGEGALVHNHGTRASTAIVATPCKLAVLDEERFKFLIENTPMFALEVMRSYSDRLRHCKELLAAHTVSGGAG